MGTPITLKTMKADTRDAVIDTLAKTWPLNARQVYSEVRDTQHLNITYQGVHKVLNQLVKEKIAVTQDRKYELDASWIKSLRKFAETADKNYSKVENVPYLEIGTGSSVEKDAFTAGREAAEKAFKQVSKKIKKVQLVLIFASGNYENDCGEIIRGTRSITKGAPLVGGITCGEINDKRLEKSVTVVIFAADERLFSAKTTSIELPKGDSPKTFESALNVLENKIKIKQKPPDAALIFLPGYSKENGFRIVATEFLKEFSNKFSPAFPLGGCLTGEWSFNKTQQFCDDKVYSDNATFVAIYTKLKMGMRRSQGFEAISNTKYKLKLERETVTKMARIQNGVIGKYEPALEVYAKDSGVTNIDLAILPEIRSLLAQNKTLPITRVSDSINSYPAVLKKNGIQFNNFFETGDIVEISKTTPQNAITATKEAINEAIKQGGIKQPKIAIIFSCASLLAMLEPYNIDEIERVGKQISGIKIAGCYNLAEIGPLSTHQANGTVVALVFGNELRE